ncbi:hypothetical protein PT974_06165 [Cladobotryum mycophilum]|uniref:Uncharacterized protein n=1 Tax=Cladobotryum mycophilum TaxID=491253 RepID=A0ABR0SL26_9HYPO
MCVWVTRERWTYCGCSESRSVQKPTCGCSRIVDQGTQTWEGYCGRPNRKITIRRRGMTRWMQIIDSHTATLGNEMDADLSYRLAHGPVLDDLH